MRRINLHGLVPRVVFEDGAFRAMELRSIREGVRGGRGDDDGDHCPTFVAQEDDRVVFTLVRGESYAFPHQH
ncbi:MAG: hypothetical protein HWN65_20595 [Candidatus Helarchaeota archaeon]|nr:hypothetical protein [Candidatus Helarchaeota archaeon]